MIIRPKCSVCNRNLAEKRGQGFAQKCRSCRGSGRAVGKLTYRKHKKDHCENELCPLKGTAYEPYILDVDHLDGDKTNMEVNNLVTLCCLCHRRKTHSARDYVNTRYREIV
jgi:hypothetical protein